MGSALEQWNTPRVLAKYKGVPRRINGTKTAPVSFSGEKRRATLIMCFSASREKKRSRATGFVASKAAE
jgi:hypothetical protein